jgi:hypothetical protein
MRDCNCIMRTCIAAMFFSQQKTRLRSIMSENLRTHDTLLTWVTVVNVDDSMINKRILNKKMKQKNLQALNLIMMKLIKPDTSMLFSKSITLKDFKSGLRNQSFLAVTKITSLNSLRSVHLYVFSYSSYELTLWQNDFLLTKPVLQCLKPHILMAQVSAQSL